jgi:8-oxo-dGTP pyrophosphatase MutT (NUDIX family)
MSNYINFTPDAIAAALRDPLPGGEAQQRMSPLPGALRSAPQGHDPRNAGVLLLLYPGRQGHELFLVLTRRTDTLPEHTGQISLPGGGVEPGDPSLTHTALREACEEIGVCADEIRILGGLSTVYVEPTDYCIHPYVAYVVQRPVFLPEPAEVAELIEVPLSHLLNERIVKVEDWVVRGKLMRVPYFDVFGHKVWGATAIVLSEFLAVLRRLESDVS